jgi:Transcriptional regulatory protein, C terminal
MELTREGVAVPLGSRAAEILLFLIHHAGDAVHKNALLGAIWPDRVVEENNLTVHMAALRRALGDNTPGTRFIRTEPGRGYRFVAAVQEDVAAPATAAGGPAGAGRGKPWEALHRGLWHLERVTSESNAIARELFEQSIAIDPQFAQPHAWLVHTFLNEIYLFHTLDNATAVARAEQHGLRAVALDANDATAHAALAWAASATGDAAAGWRGPIGP